MFAPTGAIKRSPSQLAEYRSAAGTCVPTLSWKVLFSYPFVQQEHINLLEVMAAISVVKRLYPERWRNVRILIGLDSRVAIGGLGKGWSSSWRLNRLLRQMCGWARAGYS